MDYREIHYICWPLYVSVQCSMLRKQTIQKNDEIRRGLGYKMGICEAGVNILEPSVYHGYIRHPNARLSCSIILNTKRQSCT